MSRRGPYMKYYDANSQETMPRSTLYEKEGLRKRGSCEGNIIEKDIIKTHADQQLPTTKTVEHEVQHRREETIDTDMSDVVPECSSFSSEGSKRRKSTQRRCDKEKESAFRTHVCNCSDTNVAEVLLLFLYIAMKHSLSWIALLDHFEVLNYIFKKKVFPVTKYKLKKLVGVDTECLFNHVICAKCGRYLGKTASSNFQLSCNCGEVVKSSTVGSFFIEIDVVSQLRKLFADPIILQSLDERFHRNKIQPDALEDIFDGDVYQQYCYDDNLLGNSMNFSYTFNTDGCQAADNSKVTIWPIYIMIHEFSDYLRKKCMPLIGLWVAKTEPDMKVFLQPFVDQANKLSSLGFEWKFGEKKIISKMFPLGCCVDSVARCAILNMKKFNGIHGCTYCEHPTETVQNSRKYPMMEDVPLLRTDESIKNYMIEAHTNNKTDVMGVWGPSALINLNHFSLTKGMILDFMHSCLLGVTELHTTIITTNVNKKYYIGSPANILLIDEKLMAIKPPSCIPKPPRSLKEKNLWKASEWLSWLVIYSLICLRDILPKKYYNHWALFVAAINILLQDSISLENLRKAGILLVKFVFYFDKFYGKRYMHYNVHLLLHLKDTVQNWGPLWSSNTFAFENQNMLLLRKKNCNNRIAQQIVYRLIIYQQLPILERKNFISDKTRNLCQILCNNNRLKNIEKIENCYLLGCGKDYEFSDIEMQLLDVLNISQTIECKQYFKIICNGCRYVSFSYKRCAKNNDSVFQTKDNKFGIIQKIFKIKEASKADVIILYNKIDLHNSFIVNNEDVTVEHIQRMKIPVKNNLHVIRCSMIHRPCVVMQARNKLFITKLSKGLLGKIVN